MKYDMPPISSISNLEPRQQRWAQAMGPLAMLCGAQSESSSNPCLTGSRSTLSIFIRVEERARSANTCTATSRIPFVSDSPDSTSDNFVERTLSHLRILHLMDGIMGTGPCNKMLAMADFLTNARVVY